MNLFESVNIVFQHLKLAALCADKRAVVQFDANNSGVVSI